MKKLSKNKKGFTYLEMVLTIAVMVMIIYVIFIQKQIAEYLPVIRNSERKSEILNIAQVLYAYNITNNGFPEGLTSNFQEICSEVDKKICEDNGLLYLGDIVNYDAYFVELPKDPLVTKPYSTGYKVTIQNNRIITVAPLAELKVEIKVIL